MSLSMLEVIAGTNSGDTGTDGRVG